MKVDKWQRIYGTNYFAENGPYLVTVEDSLGRRFTTFAEYKNGEWIIIGNGLMVQSSCRVVAFLDQDINNIIEAYDGPTQKFKVGDTIVWDDKEYGKCWMVIKGFDFPSDMAARAAIGKNVSIVYTDFSPGSLTSDNARLADENELNDIINQITEHYKSYYNIKGEFIGKTILELDYLKSANKEIYEMVKEQL